MCEPTTIAAGATLAVNAASSLVGHFAQQEAHEQNRRAALRAAREASSTITLRQLQEAEAAKQTIFDMDMEARRAEAQTRVMAGESGVAGTSVSLLLDDLERQRLLAEGRVEREQENIHEQLERERKGVWAQYRSRVNAVPAPSWLSTSLQIAGAGVDAYGMYARNRKPTPSSGGR